MTDSEIRAAMRELRRIKREARVLWTAIRQTASLWSFLDARALAALDHAIERAYPNIDPRDLHTALAEHAADPRSLSPWNADQWIAQARTSREHRAFTSLSLEDQERQLRAAR